MAHDGDPVEPARHLIGRREEIAQIERTFEDARGGRGAVVLPAGEAGVGKTRLAEGLLAQSGLEVLTRTIHECLLRRHS